MTNQLPSLSEVGFISNKNLIMSKLFGYFMASEYSQSNTFYGSICSLKYLIAENTDPSSLATAIENTLTGMYSKYFDKVTVQVDQEEQSNNIVHINIGIRASDSNPFKEYYLYKEIKTKEGNMVEFESQLDTLYNLYGD